MRHPATCRWTSITSSDTPALLFLDWDSNWIRHRRNNLRGTISWICRVVHDRWNDGAGIRIASAIHEIRIHVNRWVRHFLHMALRRPPVCAVCARGWILIPATNRYGAVSDCAIEDCQIYTLGLITHLQIYRAGALQYSVLGRQMDFGCCKNFHATGFKLYGRCSRATEPDLREFIQ